MPGWQRRPWPVATRLAGTHCRLEPLSAEHADPLYRAVADGSDDGIWTYLTFGPYPDAVGFADTVRGLVADPAVSSFAIIDSADGATVGMASFHRIDPQVGSLEIAQLLYAPRLQQTTGATEAVTLLATYALLPAAGVEVRCAQRAVAPRRPASGLPLRGTVPQRHGLQGANPRHRLVRDHRRGLARGEGRAPPLPGPGELRHRRPAAAIAHPTHSPAGVASLRLTCVRRLSVYPARGPIDQEDQ